MQAGGSIALEPTGDDDFEVYDWVVRGIALQERAVERDPSNAQAWVVLGAALLLTGNAERAVEMLRQGIRLSPRDHRVAFWGGLLALALARVGHLDEAIAEARVACRRDDKFYPSRVTLAAVLAQAGWTQDTAAALHDACRIRNCSGGVTFRSRKRLEAGH